MTKASAFAPASISLLFRSCPNKNLSKMGSVGIGFTINRGVRADVERSNITSILFNGKPIIFPTVVTVINALTQEKLSVKIQSDLPLGFGFGISSASAIATAYELNRLLSLNKPKNELIQLVHAAEIVNKTGLGSVGTQTTGGFIFKTSPGIPFRYKRFPFSGKKIYAVIIGKLETPGILGGAKMTKINKTADQIIKDIQKLTHPTLEQLIDLSYHFAKMSGLLINPKVINLIEEIRISGGHATMAMLGDVVISNIKPKTRYPIEELTITEKGSYAY